MVDEKLYVELGGFRQKIHIKTKDKSMPVLLFLHGGPGVVNRHAIMTSHSDLTDSFTLVCWDQRGSGGSYFGAKEEDLTVARLTDDAAELVDWLRKRFGKDKIFVIGGSWGSELGSWLCFRYPAGIAAYVGFGQVVDGDLNEKISYSFTLDAAKKAGDSKSVKLLESVGPPEKGQYCGGLNGMMTQRRIMMKYGGYSQSKARRSYFDSMVKPMILSGEYSVKDMIGAALGYKFVLKKMWAEVGDTNLAKTCAKYEMPYFIFDGKLDFNTPAELVEDYFNKIEAPYKELIWFTESGHNPMSDEPEKFKKLLREKLTQVANAEKAKGAVV